ncbi:sugar phosphate isomerase/epimerase family protein, partial [Chloroflexota bacterium]
TWDSRVIDLDKASQSVDYCDELKGRCNGLEITELATHLQGHLVAVNKAYDAQFDLLAPTSLRRNHRARTDWAVDQMKMAIKASRNLGLSVVPTQSGSLLWHYMYPFPQRPEGLVDLAFRELAKRWQPILDTAQECGIDLAYEVHPGDDIHDGITFERFLKETGNHERVNILYDPSHLLLQCLDYMGYIMCYKDYIKAFHVKDAEYNASPSSGVYGGYQEWKDRPGRFRSPGDGQINFKRIFTKITEIGYSSWAVLEWECCIKDAAQGAREGADFIRSMLIDVTQKSFDDFAGGGVDGEFNRGILGLN